MPPSKPEGAEKIRGTFSDSIHPEKSSSLMADSRLLNHSPGHH